MPNFQTLWDNFPDHEEMAKRCQNKQGNGNSQPFDNYCSILLSECLNKSGVLVNACPGQKCWSHPGNKHVLRAEELANWLAKSPPAGFKSKEDISASSFQKDLSGKTGVIFFKDYWQRGNETTDNRSGDHIDLWNKNRITGGSMLYRSLIEFFGIVSDLNMSKAVWFWEVK